MRPISRAASAIEIIDNYLVGKPIELTLKNWFKNNRFAGSNDRYLIRDIVFEILRRRRSLAYPFKVNGYKEGGRILVLSYLAEFYDLSSLKNITNNNKYFLEPPNLKEIAILSKKKSFLANAPRYISLDYPSFLEDDLYKSLGMKIEPIMATMQKRAPTYLRVNLLKTTIDEAEFALASEGIICSRSIISKNSLKVCKGRRFIRASNCYNSGIVEIQDISSQMMTDLPEITEGMRIFDYCAGGGGKALAIASKIMNKGELIAYDINKKRLSPLKQRAIRAGAKVKLLKSSELKNYISGCDVVFVDSPCSGSGTWRRDPEAKWNLTKEKFEIIREEQASILIEACKYVTVGGVMVYVVCSLLQEEGEMQSNRFLFKMSNFRLVNSYFLHPLIAGDGFFRVILKRLK